ncbi:hypothetical protein BDZ45DRAFT_738900 [Acephala macrosclerotiorum]|nr:hypothetical protein BDZ45DRAFT_738900 [Acephala macrosclerotiorum]
MLLLPPASLAQRICYFSDDTAADGYSACNNSTEHSGCCRLYQTNGTPVDLYTTNGLCLRRNGVWNGVWNGFFSRSGCTDSTWQSSDCPKACPEQMVLVTAADPRKCLRSSSSYSLPLPLIFILLFIVFRHIWRNASNIYKLKFNHINPLALSILCLKLHGLGPKLAS